MVMANDTAKADSSDCNMNCDGDSNSKYDGVNRINLYVANDLLSLQPCGWKPDAVSLSTTSTTSATTSSSSTSSTSSSSSTRSSVSSTASSGWYNYGPGNPVGKVELPLVGCNDLKDGFKNRPFKLYDATDSRQYKSYRRFQTNDACAEACKAQYDDYVNVYVESRKRLSGKNYFARLSLEKVGIESRWFNFFNEGWDTANTKCKAQYSDYLVENRNVDINARCNSFGSGY